MDSVALAAGPRAEAWPRAWDFVQRYPAYAWLSTLLDHAGLDWATIVLPSGLPETFRRALYDWLSHGTGPMPDPTGLKSATELAAWAAARRAQASHIAPRLLWRGDEPNQRLRQELTNPHPDAPHLTLRPELREQLLAELAELRAKPYGDDEAVNFADNCRNHILSWLKAENSDGASLQLIWERLTDTTRHPIAPGVYLEVIQPITELAEITPERYDELAGQYVILISVWRELAERYGESPALAA
jgi:hypothetical protein